ncbi:uncharacterized protein LOC129956733 [Argiope bruennichi]|uniref:uncharacterized protein LOC129956733 n=1 Tax=Argiope bruennichi TaxID=94029 RepID=UPI002495A86B|nr:uncharacterized protein LOC129956733 [Argiope bruennichi]
MHQVKEFFHIKRCNKCQGFRHLAKDCPNTRPFCGNCAGHHKWCASTMQCTTKYTGHSTQSATALTTRAAPATRERSEIATSALLDAKTKFQPNIILVQEPYILDGRIAGIPRSRNQYTSKNNKAGIITLPTYSKPLLLSTSENSISIKIQTDKGPLTVTSSYSSPNGNIQEATQEIEQLITNLNEESIIIGADWNAHNRLWGYPNEDTKVSLVEDFLLTKELFLLNDANSPPTFEHNFSKDWPDLTIVKGADLANSAKWSVSESYSHSDHKYITIEINIPQTQHHYTRFKTAYGGHKRMLNILATMLPEINRKIKESRKKTELKAIIALQSAIYKACKKVYKIKKVKTTHNNWWNQSLQIRKKELQALKRRLNKSPIAEKTQ